MSESGLLPRLAAAASVVGHLTLVIAILLYAGVRPFETESPKAIAVDLVTPDEIKPPEQPATPPEPEVKLPDLKPTVETPRQSEPQTSPPPQPQAAPQPQQQAAPEQHAAAPQAAQQQVRPQQQPQSPPPSTPAFTPPEPDLTVKYGVTLGLPDAASKSDFDAIAADSAKLTTADIAAFRRHLKTCSPMPDSVTASDDVWIKLRAVFTHDGRLAVPPVLIEGKASPKAIAIAHGAIAALQTCQPYPMLPADKYDEWKVLDLEFSPKDFTAR